MPDDENFCINWLSRFNGNDLCANVPRLGSENPNEYIAKNFYATLRNEASKPRVILAQKKSSRHPLADCL